MLAQPLASRHSAMEHNCLVVHSNKHERHEGRAITNVRRLWAGALCCMSEGSTSQSSKETRRGWGDWPFRLKQGIRAADLEVHTALMCAEADEILPSEQASEPKI